MSDVHNGSILKTFTGFSVIFITLFSLALLNCNGDKPVTSDSPEVYDLAAPDSLIKGIADTSMIYISVRDPQGLENIDSVYFTTTRPDGSSNGYVFYMFDDGVNGGDSLADDGIYSQGIQSPDMNAQTGDYIFSFIARDLDGNVSNKIDKTITAYEYNNPIIRSAVINQYDAAGEHLYLSATVYDAQGWTNIQRVWVELTYMADSTGLGEFDLNDMGISGDSTAVDSRFSLNLSSPIDSTYSPGEYRVVFQAIDWNDNEAIPIETTYIISNPSLRMR